MFRTWGRAEGANFPNFLFRTVQGSCVRMAPRGAGRDIFFSIPPKVPITWIVGGMEVYAVWIEGCVRVWATFDSVLSGKGGGGRLGTSAPWDASQRRALGDGFATGRPARHCRRCWAGRQEPRDVRVPATAGPVRWLQTGVG